MFICCCESALFITPDCGDISGMPLGRLYWFADVGENITFGCPIIITAPLLEPPILLPPRPLPAPPRPLGDGLFDPLMTAPRPPPPRGRLPCGIEPTAAAVLPSGVVLPLPLLPPRW